MRDAVRRTFAYHFEEQPVEACTGAVRALLWLREVAAVFATLVWIGMCAQSCAECTVVQEKVRLCAPHVEEERVTFQRLRKPLAAKTSAERIAALEEIAHLTTSHPNAPSEAVARRLAQALEDEDPAVRTRAVDLLGQAQNALVALEALLETLSATEREHLRLDKELREVVAKRRSGRGPSGEELERREGEISATLDGVLAWRKRILEALGFFPDERVVTALRELSQPRLAAFPKARERNARKDILEVWQAQSEARERLPAAMDVNAPLVRLGSHTALAVVLENLTVLRDELDLLRQDDGKSSDGPPGLRPILEAQLSRMHDARIRTLAEIRAVLATRATTPVPERLQLETYLEELSASLDSAPGTLPGVRSPCW